jgi:hypothetical protein
LKSVFLPKILLPMVAALLTMAQQACSQQPAPETPSAPFAWPDQGCDSTLRVSAVSALDLVLPFYPDDTLAAGLAEEDVPTPIRVFAVVVDSLGKTRWAALGADSLLRPRLLAGASPTGWEPLRLTLPEQTYLRALVDQPKYLFRRWEFLLNGARSEWLAKRDSLLDSLKSVYPSYTFRILNDLRTAGMQARFLKRGSSNAPLSQHQFGLAVDVGIISKGKLLKGFNTYAAIGRLTPHYGLTWGGTFVGFVDPNHFQLVKNSAALVRKFPELRFEFEPYRRHYLRRVAQKIAEGEEDEVQDTEELLAVMNQQRRMQPCPCESELAATPSVLQTVQTGLQAVGYLPARDVLLLGHLPSQTLTATRGATRLTYRMGKWR